MLRKCFDYSEHKDDGLEGNPETHQYFCFGTILWLIMYKTSNDSLELTQFFLQTIVKTAASL